MSWVRQAKRALAAGSEVQVQPRGTWLTSYFKGEDELTLSPVDPVDLCRRDLIFIQRKSGYVIRLVLNTRAGGILVGKTRDDEGEWIPAEAVLGRVIRIAKQYTRRDTINPKICYDYLSAGAPPAEAWGDYGPVTSIFAPATTTGSSCFRLMPSSRPSMLATCPGMTWRPRSG